MPETNCPGILVIDDDPAILALVEGALEGEGYRLELIRNPLEAFRDTDPLDYDLIITDYEMKPMKGDALTMLARVAQEGRGEGTPPLPPIIIMTGYRNEARVEEWAGSDAVRQVLEKPFDLEELREAVRAALQ